MPRFTLRDLFWLTLVVGMALGWWVHSRQQEAAWAAKVEKVQKQADSSFQEVVSRYLHGTLHK